MNKLEKRTWDEFQKCNMFKVVNIILRLFGWCLQYETLNGKINNVTPIKIVR